MIKLIHVVNEEFEATQRNIARAAIRDVFISRPSRSVLEELWPAFENQVANTVRSKSIARDVVEELINEKWIEIKDGKYQWQKSFGPVNPLDSYKTLPIIESKIPIKESGSDISQKYGCLMLMFSVKNWTDLTDLIDKDDIYDSPGFGIETEPHTTILYGFHSNVDAEDLKKITKSLKTPIHVTLSEISHFSTGKYDVVKFDVTSNILRKLNQACRKFPHTNTHDEYKPHVTIAYVKSGTGKKYDMKLKKSIALTSAKITYSTANSKHKDTWSIKEDLMIKLKSLLENADISNTQSSASEQKKTINDEFEVGGYALEKIKRALEKANKNLKSRKMNELELKILLTRTKEILPPEQEGSLMEPIKVVVFTVKIDGEIPEIHDYEFIAKIEHTEAGNIINMNPKATVNSLPTEYRTFNQRCDICKSNRERNNTFIIKK